MGDFICTPTFPIFPVLRASFQGVASSFFGIADWRQQSCPQPLKSAPPGIMVCSKDIQENDLKALIYIPINFSRGKNKISWGEVWPSWAALGLGAAPDLELWELIPLPFFLGIILLLEPAQPQFMLSLIFQKNWCSSPWGTSSSHFPGWVILGQICQKEELFPHYPCHAYLGTKLVFMEIFPR